MKIRIWKRSGRPILMIFFGKWHRNICKHGRIWKEADSFEEYGGKACRKCILGF